MYRVLLVEDDPVIAKIVQYYLSDGGDYQVSWAKDAGEALYLARKTFDVILLDIMLPDVDGLELCAKFRERMYCPIIFISCIDDEDTIVQALQMGGDDYLTKPFNCKVLRAKIEANLRRAQFAREHNSATRLDYPDFIIDVDGHAIVRGKKRVVLSPMEFRVLMYFAERPGKVVTLDELYADVWEKDSFGDVRTVIVHVYNLRKKMENELGARRCIKNLRGEGYFFDPDVEK